MNDQNPLDEPRNLFQSDYGIFYPIGWMVAAFSKKEDAQQVQRDLIIGGFDTADCLLYTSEEVAAAAEKNLSEHTGFLARLGKSDEAVQIHLNSAKEGATFLLIYASDDTATSRVMNVIRRVPFEFVHRYHRFVIEVLK